MLQNQGTIQLGYRYRENIRVGRRHTEGLSQTLLGITLEDSQVQKVQFKCVHISLQVRPCLYSRVHMHVYFRDPPFSAEDPLRSVGGELKPKTRAGQMRPAHGTMVDDTSCLPVCMVGGTRLM